MHRSRGGAAPRLGLVVLAWIARNAGALALIILILLVARHVAPPAVV